MENIEVVSPLDGQSLAKIARDTEASLDEKIIKAKMAQPNWAALGIKRRAQVMLDYRQILQKNHGELCDMIHKENGKTTDEASAEVDKAIELSEFAASLPQIMVSKSLEVSRGVNCTMTHRPLGVVASITPFNFPLMVPHWTIPIALMMGNSAILKPSEKVPLSAEKMCDLFLQAGLPKDVLAIAHGEREIVEAICSHRDISALSFVGSTEVAKKVYQTASSNLKRAACFGSAKNHLIVLPDANQAMTAKDVVSSMSGMAGQRCMAASVMVAVGDCNKIIDEIVSEARKIIPGKNLGAIISHDAKEKIARHIEEAQKEGAKIILDGRKATVDQKEKGNYFGPTILDFVKCNSSAHKEEFFGPVLSIIRAKDIDEAIAIQNASEYGNGASVYTNSGGKAKYVSERLTAGMIGVNVGVPVPREPFSFGGIKASKFGASDITGTSCANFFSQLVKYTTKWNAEDGVNWMS